MCRNNNVIPKSLHFKVSNKQLQPSAAHITCQKRLLNQEILNKQKAVKLPKPILETVKRNLNAKINYIDYVHLCTIFLVSNDKNISKVKNTQSKKLCNLLLDNTGHISKTTRDPDKVIFNFSNYEWLNAIC